MGEYADIALEEALDFEGDTHVTCQYCNCRAERVDGSIIYPHRCDLFYKKFWYCKSCDAYVGCHRKTGKPLGTLANAYLRRARRLTHKLFDRIWVGGHITRGTAYSMLSNELGIEKCKCHIGMFDLEECRNAYHAILNITKGL